MLHNRDYLVLKKSEKSKLKEVIEADLKAKEGMKYIIPPKGLLTEFYQLLPESVQIHLKLFPNNILLTKELENQKRIQSIKASFSELLESNPGEAEIQAFICSNNAYFLIGSLLALYYDFGHHQAFLFREFELPPNYVTDYLLVGMNSGGYHFVFVELETCEINPIISNGDFGQPIRKGLRQVEDWRNWLEANFHHLQLVFKKYAKPDTKFDNEFLSLDTSRIHYAVISGRRKHWTNYTYQKSRRMRDEKSVRVLHYDNLIDGIEKLLQVRCY